MKISNVILMGILVLFLVGFAGAVATQYNFTDGSYTVAKINGTGTIVWTVPIGVIKIEYLIISGGGSGGGVSSAASQWGGGGGGGGGVLNATAYSVISGSSFNITVGAGAPTGGIGSSGNIGGASSIYNVTVALNSTGGGGGGGGTANGGVGGSGGGGAGGAATTGGANVSGQGWNGGNGVAAPYYRGGGGGGWSIAGSTGTVNGNGGDGILSSITGISTRYAGGGGGGAYYNLYINGTGGLGGGGIGAQNHLNGTAGLNEFGGGGGGASGNLSTGQAGFDGGSGVVILRYFTGGGAVSANFISNTTSGNAPLIVHFTDTSTDFPDSWNWSFGDGNYSSLQEPTFIYNIPGTYSVNLSANNTESSDFELKTNYITVNPTGSPVTDFNATPVKGMIGTPIHFFDNSTGNPTSWSWNFGDTGTSTLQNPNHSYSANGLYNISLFASNVYGNDTETKNYYINITNFTGFTYVPISMDGDYLVTLHFVDSNGAPILAVSVLDSSDTTTTTTNGTISVRYPYGIVAFYVTSDGYVPRSLSYVIDEDRTETIVLTTANQNTQTQTTFWTPHNVEFTVLDVNRAKVVDTTVTAMAFESTLPGGYSGCIQTLQNAYGIPESEAETMLNSTLVMGGTTDSMGAISFLMLPTIKYNVNVTRGGITQTTTVYPKEDFYQIQLTSGNYTQPQNVASNYNSASYDVLNMTEPDVYHIKFQLFYYDAGANTDSLMFWVKCETNQTYMNWQNVTIPSLKGPVLLNYTVANEIGMQWRWGYDAHHPS